MHKAMARQGFTVGPIVLGAKPPVHILEHRTRKMVLHFWDQSDALTPTSTVRRITNMTALTSVDAAVAQAAPFPE